eukprot:UN17766
MVIFLSSIQKSKSLFNMSWKCKHCDFISFSKGSRDSHTNYKPKRSEFVCPRVGCNKKFERKFCLKRC